MITIGKAIEILSHPPKQDTLVITQQGRAALKLGVEAMKEVRHLRWCHGCFVSDRLPGETREL